MSELAVQKNDKVSFASPVLKWAGGKGMLLPQLSEKFPHKLRCGAIKNILSHLLAAALYFLI